LFFKITLFFSFLHTEGWTQGLLGRCSTTWATPPVHETYSYSWKIYLTRSYHFHLSFSHCFHFEELSWLLFPL
jgi:hypothetical protein